MSIKMPSGFVITTQEPIDNRLVMSKAQMRSVADERMPQHYFSLCSDDNRIYVYDKNNTPSVETGKFVYVENTNTSLIRGYFYNNTFWITSAHTTQCEKSLDAIYVDLTVENAGDLYTWSGSQYLRACKGGGGIIYQEAGYNTDGAMSQKIVTEGVQSIGFELDDEQECVKIKLPWDNA